MEWDRDPIEFSKETLTSGMRHEHPQRDLRLDIRQNRLIPIIARQHLQPGYLRKVFLDICRVIQADHAFLNQLQSADLHESSAKSTIPQDKHTAVTSFVIEKSSIASISFYL